MFLDVGWSEIFLIGIVTILVFGPEEIPRVMTFLGRAARRLQYIRFAMTRQFDDYMKEAGLEDLRGQVNFEAKDFNEAASDEDFIEIFPEEITFPETPEKLPDPH